MYGSGVDDGRIMPWQCGTMYLELVQKRDFSFLVLFFYNHVMLVKVMGIMTLYAFFWIIPRRLNFICRSFGTLCRSIFIPAYEDGTEYSETSAYKIQPPGNYPEESIKHSEHGESLKSGIMIIVCVHAFTFLCGMY